MILLVLNTKRADWITNLAHSPRISLFNIILYFCPVKLCICLVGLEQLFWLEHWWNNKRRGNFSKLFLFWSQNNYIFTTFINSLGTKSKIFVLLNFMFFYSLHLNHTFGTSLLLCWIFVFNIYLSLRIVSKNSTWPTQSLF